MLGVETALEGCFIIEPNLITDDRGYFYESFHAKKFADIVGISPTFVQDNESRSQYGVVRGLHAQDGEYAQAKLVRVTEGRVLDVAVDVRQQSPTYGQWISVELSAENKRQLFLPRGFLHGFSVLSPCATFCYKCDNWYHRDSEVGITPMDDTLSIDWQLPFEDLILSEKDRIAPTFNTLYGKR